MIGIIIGLVVLGFILIWDIVVMSVVGFPTSDKKILELLETLKNNQPSEIEYPDESFRNQIKNMYNTKILDETLIYTFQKPFISKGVKGLTFGWYVDGMGAVPRWYKSHSEISKLYNELKNK